MNNSGQSKAAHLNLECGPPRGSGGRTQVLAPRRPSQHRPNANVAHAEPQCWSGNDVNVAFQRRQPQCHGARAVVGTTTVARNTQINKDSESFTERYATSTKSKSLMVAAQHTVAAAQLGDSKRPYRPTAVKGTELMSSGAVPCHHPPEAWPTINLESDLQKGGVGSALCSEGARPKHQHSIA